MVYEKDNLTNEKSTTETTDNTKYPFKIIKDYSKHKKNTSVVNFLGKKRIEFFTKMQNREKKPVLKIPEGFLRGKSEKVNNDICVNTDSLFWSIQEENNLDLNDDGLDKEEIMLMTTLIPVVVLYLNQTRVPRTLRLP